MLGHEDIDSRCSTLFLGNYKIAHTFPNLNTPAFCFKVHGLTSLSELAPL